MGTARFMKAMAAVVLFNGVLFLCVREDALAGEKEEDAKKYTEQLRKGKDAKSKVVALQSLGELAQIKKSFIADALPDVYKAIEDKDAGKFATVPLGEADALAVGERVFAIGSPLGLERTVTEGILSTKTRPFCVASTSHRSRPSESTTTPNGCPTTTG